MAFPALPRPQTTRGTARLAGVEIEYAGLTEDDTARLIVRHLGGQASQKDSHAVTVRGTELGDIEIVLDTSLRQFGGNKIVDAALDAARGLVPVEIVTQPLDLEGLDLLDRFRDHLRRAGAVGTAQGALLGFGVHLNVEVVAADDPFTIRTILAFGLIERWLRRDMQIDLTRRLMPFVDPWPTPFVNALAQSASSLDLNAVRALYAAHCRSRNFGLDLLPIFKDADEDEFALLFPDQEGTKGRPAFHYRLPDCRIDNPDWSLETEWSWWRLVERVADNGEMLDDLATAFCSTEGPTLGDAAWIAHVERVLGRGGVA